MIDFKSIEGKKIALVVWNAEREDDVRVFLGEIVREDENYAFVNHSRKWHFTVLTELFERLKEVPKN